MLLMMMLKMLMCVHQDMRSRTDEMVDLVSLGHIFWAGLVSGAGSWAEFFSSD